METQAFDFMAMVHLIMLSLWGGVIACFAVGLLCAGGAATLGFRFALERFHG